MVRNDSEPIFFDLNLSQINAKRHWRKRVKRIMRMVRLAASEGADVITLNEVDKAMVMAIKAMPGWDIYWTINDQLRGGNWAGNAVAWRVKRLKATRTWASPVEIQYKKGKKFGLRSSKWFTKTIKQACVRLETIDTSDFAVAVQAYHYPTRFNSNEESRKACVEDTELFLQLRVERDMPVIAAGDGNGARPKVQGVQKVAKDGPDEAFSNGKRVRSRVLHTFKILGLSDHAGLFMSLRFRMN